MRAPLRLCLVLLFAATPSRAAAASLAGDNVIVVDFDTLRADALENPRGLTPNLDALAARSFRFTTAVAQAPWTLPSTMSFFTSLYPHQHGVLNKYAVFSEDRKELARLPSRFSTMAEVFRRSGYATAGFTGDAGVGSEFGFGRGFDVYFDSVSFGGFDTTFPLALNWLKDHSDRKFFLFIHGYDVHGQFPLPAGFRSRFADPAYRGPFTGAESEFLDLRMKTIKGEPISISTGDARFWRDRYDEQTLRADERFGRFWKEFGALAVSSRTVVVIMGDHGEQFGEHGGFDHGMTLYDELLRVPLIIGVPGAAPERIDAQVRLIDVLPTLVDWLGLSADSQTRRQMQGASLVPLTRGRPLALDAFAETSFLLQTEKCALRTSDGWKLVYDFETLDSELYDLRRDPGEKRDLRRERLDVAKTLAERLLRWNAARAPD
ncbi:MAG TPA: sulfatase [Elusimicrobiota bacterium]|nr:sulfatase [Elusimicrobiota bacterium]